MENKEASVMKGKKGWKQRACLCLMVFLIGLSGLAGASSRDDIYRGELDILYAMVQSGSSYILFGEERDDLMAVWEGVRDLSRQSYRRQPAIYRCGNGCRRDSRWAGYTSYRK